MRSVSHAYSGQVFVRISVWPPTLKTNLFLAGSFLLNDENINFTFLLLSFQDLLKQFEAVQADILDPLNPNKTAVVHDQISQSFPPNQLDGMTSKICGQVAEQYLNGGRQT